MRHHRTAQADGSVLLRCVIPRATAPHRRRRGQGAVTGPSGSSAGWPLLPRRAATRPASPKIETSTNPIARPISCPISCQCQSGLSESRSGERHDATTQAGLVSDNTPASGDGRKRDKKPAASAAPQRWSSRADADSARRQIERDDATTACTATQSNQTAVIPGTARRTTPGASVDSTVLVLGQPAFKQHAQAAGEALKVMRATGTMPPAPTSKVMAATWAAGLPRRARSSGGMRSSFRGGEQIVERDNAIGQIVTEAADVANREYFPQPPASRTGQ